MQSFLEPPNCCPIISLSETQNKFLNQLYFTNGTLVSNRPLYVGSDQYYGIWFDGKDDWIVGKLSTINEGRLTRGYMANDEAVDCPSNSQHWKEYFDGAWSSYENDINLKCAGKLVKLLDVVRRQCPYLSVLGLTIYIQF